jgi:histidinol-phosphate aminotransferase
MKNLEELIRPHLLNLIPYSSARDEYSGEIGIFLDANENAFGSIIGEKLNRYPDPYQKKLKEKISKIKGCSPESIFLGNGSDEPIDLIIKLFCNPGQDNVIVNPPTYDMYSVASYINNTEVRKVVLNQDYQLDIANIFAHSDPNTKIIFLCSPNNPTGNSLNKEDVLHIINKFEGITVIDEAYIDFAPHNGFLRYLGNHRNLIILHTMSKAWGLAGLRLGMAFASPEIITMMNKIKYPYNINQVTQQLVLSALDNENRKDLWVQEILKQKRDLENELNSLEIVKRVFPSDANFLLVKFNNATSVFKYLLENSIIVRNRSRLVLCDNALRITVGTGEENKSLMECLRNYQAEI